MKLLLEEYKYPVELVREVLHGVGSDALQDIEGDVSLSYVGYFYNPEIKDCVFILPKVLVDEHGCVFGREDLKPEHLLEKDLNHLTQTEQRFIYEFAVWIYRAVVVFQQAHPQSEIIHYKQISQISHTKRRRTNTMLDVLLSLIQFNKDHQDFITFTLRNIHSGFNKINWTRTINRSQAIVQDGCPVYLNPVNKKRQVNFDEELLIIFYSILNYIKEKYGFKVNINVGFQLIKGAQFESYINGRGKIRLRQIKYKYFSDIALELWELCYAFFDRSQSIYASTELKDFLLVKNFYIVFEAIIDELLGSNDEKRALDGRLVEQRDGKIVDHLYTYKGLMESYGEDTQTYYIGDSKYYKIGHQLGETSIYKQYTYARNIIQYNIDLWLGREKAGFTPEIKVRDDQTEGYNILPNFFISADMKKGDFSYSHRDIELLESTKKEPNPRISYQFPDRLFDRDTLLLSRYNVNFLFVTALYARNNASEKATWRKEARDKFREEIQKVLKEKYHFFALKSKGNVLAGEQFLKDNFKELQGKLFRPYEDKSIYALALEKSDAAADTSNAYQLLSEFFVIKPIELGESPVEQLDAGVAAYQKAHPYRPIPQDWLPEYHVERYEDAYFVIGLYHDEAHWDWITGKNDKGSLIYNVRLEKLRAGHQTKSHIRQMKPKFVILYEQGKLHENKYRVFRVHDYAEMSENRMRLAQYPTEPQGDYFIFRMDEEVRIGEFDINMVVSAYMIEHKEEYKGQPIYITGKDLIKWKK